MTDDKLADEISRQRFSRDDDLVSLNEDQWQQIIAALRRSGPIISPDGVVTFYEGSLERQPSSDQVLVRRDELETLQLIASSAIKTRSRDVQDWMQDMERVQAKAEVWLAAAEAKEPR